MFYRQNLNIFTMYQIEHGDSLSMLSMDASVWLFLGGAGGWCSGII